MRSGSAIQKYKEASRAKEAASSEHEKKKGKTTAAVASKSASTKRVIEATEELVKAKSESGKIHQGELKKAKAALKGEEKSQQKGTAPASRSASAATGATAKNTPKLPDPAEEKTQELLTSEEEANDEGLKSKEAELVAEIAQEVKKDEATTSRIVNSDLSPVNMDRNQLIVEYAPLIKFIAHKIAARLPANVELDDLISSGVIGLMDAIDKYDCTRDNKFKTYAEFRIRGAILDELRAQDWVPRSVREKAKQLERVYAKIEQEKGRQATEEEVCQTLGVSREEYYELLNDVKGISLLSFDDLANLSSADKKVLHGLNDGGGGKGGNPFSEISGVAVRKVIAEAISDLPEKQRLVLSLYYYEDLNLKEIGKILDVTESRVSQLHTQAVLKLKTRLRLHWDELATVLG